MERFKRFVRKINERWDEPPFWVELGNNLIWTLFLIWVVVLLAWKASTYYATTDTSGASLGSCTVEQGPQDHLNEGQPQ